MLYTQRVFSLSLGDGDHFKGQIFHFPRQTQKMACVTDGLGTFRLHVEKSVKQKSVLMTLSLEPRGREFSIEQKAGILKQQSL